MDTRQTFRGDKEVLTAIQALQKEGVRGELLIDDEGLTRVGGMITGILEASEIKQCTITLDSGSSFTIGAIIAVNGVFRSDYSEC